MYFARYCCFQKLNYFCSFVRSIWLLEGVPFAKTFCEAWCKNILHWILEKDTTPLYTEHHFVMSDWTHVYMKLCVPTELISFLYHSLYYIYITIYILNAFFRNVEFINNKKTFLQIISVIFRLFTNLLWTNLNQKCKNVYVIGIFTR